MPRFIGFVSVVAPVANAGGYIEEFVREALAVLREEFRDGELVVVDDASTDDTLAKLDPLVKANADLRVVRLSRRYGSDVATVAGLDTAIGDYIAILRADRDPLSELPAMVRAAASGHGIVTGTVPRSPSDGVLTRGLRKVFHIYTNRVLHLNFPKYGTTFQVLTRAAASAVTRSRLKRPTFPVLASQVGFGSATHPYVPVPRAGVPAGPGLLERIDRGITVLVTSSLSPLRAVSYLGVAAATLNLLYAFYVVGVNLFAKHVAEGWTTLSLQISGMFFVAFLVLAVLCEYVGRTLAEATDRPLYHVQEERSGSEIVALRQTRNIEEKSA